MASTEAPRRIFRSTRKRPNNASVRGTVFHINRQDSGITRQIAFTDEFLSLAQANGATVVLPTPYNVGKLFDIISQSNMLQQCIDAYVTNTILAGWEVGETQRGRKQDESEATELLSFIEHANTEESMSTVMANSIRDRESVGFGFTEIIRDAMGDLSLLRYCPALFTRLCAKHPKDILVTQTIMRGRRVSTIKEWRRFRRYVQIVNGQSVWFKEFGDPRRMSYHNGSFEGEPGYDPTKIATEIYHWKNPSNESYGIPKWTNQLPSIIGSREAEEVNMRYFQDNTVPPMLLIVGNGRLTQQSYRELTKMLNEENIGSERQNKIMLLEAIGEGDSLDGKSSPIEIKVEKLTDARQSDGLFSAYDDANMAKVRSSFRLPPITVGMSQDVNFATASTSAFVAESQVFGPARNQIDEVLNNLFVNGPFGLKMQTVKLISRTPSITSPEMVMKALTALNVMGALTPRTAQEAGNKMLQMEIPAYPEKDSEDWEEWMDKPISFAQRGPRGAGYDAGAEDGAIPGAAVIDEQGNPIPGATAIDATHPAHPDNAGGAITPGGKAKTTQGAQKLKDASTKKIEKGGNIGPTNPKNGAQ